MRTSSMLKYSRLKTCGVQKQGAEFRVVTGVLEDELYAMHCEIRVQWSNLTIQSIKTSMKRFTTDRCLLAKQSFKVCEGWSIDTGLDGKIKKEIGRNGCRHMAVLIVDCLNALVRVEFSRELSLAVALDPLLDQKLFLDDFLKKNPRLINYLKLA